MTKARRRGVAQTAPCAVVEPEYPVLRCALAGVPVDIGAAVAVDYLGDPWRRDIIDRFARVEIRRLAAAVGGDRPDGVAVAEGQGEEVTLAVPDMKLWSPSDPYLHHSKLGRHRPSSCILLAEQNHYHPTPRV